MNKSFETLTGLKDVVGKKVSDVIPGIKQSNPELIEIYGRVASTGKPEQFEIFLEQLQNWFWVSVYSPEKGTFTAVFEIITKRKQAEEALAKERQTLNAIMENTDTQLAYLDQDFNFTKVNSAYARGSGHTANELIGKNHFAIFPNAENQAIFERVRDTGKAMTFHDKPFIFSDQPLRGVTYWDWTLAPVMDNSGKVLGIALSLVDRTNYKRYEEEIKELNDTLQHRAAQLETANAELEGFAYSISHDLRAPLRSIQGFSQAVIEDYAAKLDENGQGYLRRVQDATVHMGALIDSILKISRVSRADMSLETVNLSEIVSAMATDFKAASPERECEFIIEPDVIGHADWKLIRIALENLMGNAWKFTEKTRHARIEFGVNRDNGKQIYFVRDNGAGFDMAYVEKLFMPFQHLHKPSDFPGTGIGLATVKRIIQRHGGRIWATGSINKGATFYFTLEPGEVK